MNSPSTLLRQLKCQSCGGSCEGHNKFWEIFRNETMVKLLLVGKRPTPTLTFYSILWILTPVCLNPPTLKPSCCGRGTHRGCGDRKGMEPEPGLMGSEWGAAAGGCQEVSVPNGRQLKDVPLLLTAWGNNRSLRHISLPVYNSALII